jgi:hypothetical protein
MNACVNPAATAADAGEAVIDCKTGPVTVSCAVPLIGPWVAVMVTGPPAATPVASPELLMVAVPVLEDPQPTCAVRF